MQNHSDHPKEFVADAGTAGVVLTLGDHLYTRYGGSPGVLSLGTGPSLAGRIARFANRLPLLSRLQQRWNGESRQPWPDFEWLNAFAPRPRHSQVAARGGTKTTSLVAFSGSQPVTAEQEADADLSDSSSPELTDSVVRDNPATTVSRTPQQNSMGRIFSDESDAAQGQRGTANNAALISHESAAVMHHDPPAHIRNAGQLTIRAQRKGSAAAHGEQIDQGATLSAEQPSPADSSTLPNPNPLVHSRPDSAESTSDIRRNQTTESTWISPNGPKSQGTLRSDTGGASNLPTLKTGKVSAPLSTARASVERRVLRRQIGIAPSKPLSQPAVLSGGPKAIEEIGAAALSTEQGSVQPRILRRHMGVAPSKLLSQAAVFSGAPRAAKEIGSSVKRALTLDTATPQKASPGVLQGPMKQATETPFSLPHAERKSPATGAYSGPDAHVPKVPSDGAQHGTSVSEERIVARVRPNDARIGDKPSGSPDYEAERMIFHRASSTVAGNSVSRLLQRHQNSSLTGPNTSAGFQLPAQKTSPLLSSRAVNSTSPATRVVVSAENYALTQADGHTLSNDGSETPDVPAVVSREGPLVASTPSIVQRSTKEISDTWLVMRKHLLADSDSMITTSSPVVSPRTDSAVQQSSASQDRSSSHLLMNHSVARNADFGSGLRAAVPAPLLFTHRSPRPLGQVADLTGIGHKISTGSAEHDRVQRFVVSTMASGVAGTESHVSTSLMLPEGVSSPFQVPANADFGSGLRAAVPAPLLFTHRSPRPLGQVTDLTGIGHKISTGSAEHDRVQRFPVSTLASGVAGTESQVSTSLMLPEGVSSPPQLPANVDFNQLANRVYDLLVRRLSSERQRRGM